MLTPLLALLRILSEKRMKRHNVAIVGDGASTVTARYRPIVHANVIQHISGATLFYCTEYLNVSRVTVTQSTISQ